jgi:CheY-like chemotaxis protein
MRTPRILITEDEGIIALDLGARLGRLGYAVPGIVRSGEEAVRKAGETQPDVVLMDIRLRGDLDGIEAARQIRTRFNIPVIYFTAYEDEHTRARAATTRPLGFLTKPIQVDKLVAILESGLNCVAAAA